MSLTYGFYDSYNGDRVYNAEQFGSIFDGVINDGVYMNVGDQFKVTPNSGLTVNIGTGRAWFQHTWTLNTALYPITLPAADAYYPRIDFVVIRIDKRPAYRRNTFAVVSGTPAYRPQEPTISYGTDDIHEYPLAAIWVDANATTITAKNISVMAGYTGRTPFVTSPTGVVDLSVLEAKYDEEWEDWSNAKQTEYTDWFNNLVYVLDDEDKTRIEYQIQQVALSLNDQFIVRSYTCTDAIPADSQIALTRNDFNATPPTGYTPISFVRINPGNTHVVPVAFNVQAGATSNMVVLRNIYYNPITVTATIDVLYVKTSFM